MKYVYLASFIAGLLLTVRLMFFGAERSRPAARANFPLRRSEVLGVAALVAFGISGYAITREVALSAWVVLGISLAIAAVGAFAATGLAIATAKVQPDHDPDDPRFALQGHVAVVVTTIVAGGEGAIRHGTDDAGVTVRARNLADDAIEVGEDVCIERIEDGVAHVERWALVEQRL